MQENNEPSQLLPVIVRAWGDEPVMLFLHRIENNRCYVGNKNSLRPIGIPLSQVFRYTADCLSTLSHCYAQGDVRKLGELWENMSVDDFTCNKYQDVIESPHDQEHFTDSGRTPSSNAQ